MPGLIKQKTEEGFMEYGKQSMQTRNQWYVCSDVVSVRWQRSGKQARTENAVLEEIGPDGAVVQLECAVAGKTVVRLDCPTVGFDGVVRECRHEPELGYFATIAFTAGQRWSVDDYRPQHLLESTDLWPEPPECEMGCGSSNWCPTEFVARAVDPQNTMSDTVRRVAQNLAVVCGEMDATEMARCFVHHFGVPKECVLFTTFVRAYRDARENLVGPYEQPVSPLRQVCSIATLLAGMPKEALRQ
jgi:hypothetical protein